MAIGSDSVICAHAVGVQASHFVSVLPSTRLATTSPAPVFSLFALVSVTLPRMSPGIAVPFAPLTPNARGLPAASVSTVSLTGWGSACSNEEKNSVFSAALAVTGGTAIPAATTTAARRRRAGGLALRGIIAPSCLEGALLGAAQAGPGGARVGELSRDIDVKAAGQSWPEVDNHGPGGPVRTSAKITLFSTLSLVTAGLLPSTASAAENHPIVGCSDLVRGFDIPGAVTHVESATVVTGTP